MTESSNTVDIDVSERSSNSANSYIFNFLDNILLPITGVVGVLTIIILFTNYGDDLLDKCFMDRFDKSQVHFAITIKKYFLFPAYTALTLLGIIAMLLFSYARQYSPIFICKNWKQTLRMVVQISSWYFCSHALVIFLKIWISDHSCNIHPNSVSGHYNFVLYSLITTYCGCAMVGWRDKKFWIFYSLSLVFGVSVMLDTLIFGYHSLSKHPEKRSIAHVYLPPVVLITVQFLLEKSISAE
nr:unnamed protein product [Naegleria fowleri]